MEVTFSIHLRSLALALNVNWFQPFTRRSDVSLGVIYLVIFNLRLKWENVILVGVNPSSLKPLAKRSLGGWGGGVGFVGPLPNIVVMRGPINLRFGVNVN